MTNVSLSFSLVSFQDGAASKDVKTCAAMSTYRLGKDFVILFDGPLTRVLFVSQQSAECCCIILEECCDAGRTVVLAWPVADL